MSEPLQPRHLQILEQYLTASDGVIMIRYAANHIILAANRAFLAKAPKDPPPIGESIHGYVVDPNGRPCSLLSTPTAELPVGFCARLKPVDHTYQCHLFADESGYFLVGERITVGESEGLERMSLMTNELTNLTLELRRRNSDLEQANETIRELTRIDPLTNLPNRRRFAEALDAAMALARRHQQPLSLISIDIDRFKSVNDTFGHDMGDEVLKIFAGLLKDSCRGEDLPVRLGGEEFLILAPNTVVNDAYALAERLRHKLAETVLPKDVHISASFGITHLLPQDTYFSFLKRADMALYEAKSGGRNKTVVRITNDPKL
ncbi:MAG: GGDEF domain-containing protein [Verrucomicrobia bacterium]|nr:GGDEF domain-containing protein [Verrucomicrobiota bacterium]